MRDEALALAARGWSVFPCHHPALRNVGTGRWSCSCARADCSSPGKHPRTKQGVKDATSDASQIALWWADHPGSNIGLATGEPSGIYVVDLDGQQGLDTWEGLQLAWGDSPTLMATTGRGLHLYYACPTGVTLGNTAGKLGPGIDTRGTGGYVLAPPSRHISGTSYQWAGAGEPAPMPGWLVAALKDEPRPAAHLQHAAPAYRASDNDPAAWRVLGEEAGLVARTGEGARNHALFRAALKMGGLVAGGDLVLDDTFSTLLDAAKAAGLGDHEARNTIKSGLRLGHQTPRVIRTRS